MSGTTPTKSAAAKSRTASKTPARTPAGKGALLRTSAAQPACKGAGLKKLKKIAAAQKRAQRTTPTKLKAAEGIESASSARAESARGGRRGGTQGLRRGPQSRWASRKKKHEMAAAPLMVTISGIRGIAGESLTVDVVNKYVSAFAEVLRKHSSSSSEQKKNLIVVGRDSRTSGPWVRDVAVCALRSAGYDVEDCGIVPTPTVQLLVQRRSAAGGLIVTSSHNPAPWNGLKFVDDDGLFLSPERCAELFAIADAAEARRGALRSLPEGAAAKEHVDAILALPFIDAAAVAGCGFRVCLDTVCGAGGPAMKMVLERLGCTVVALNPETTGLFPHTPEPVPENLGDLCRAVVSERADLGIAVDPDVDRCVIIDERGKPLVEEYTLAIAVRFMLGDVGRRGTVCKNLSTTRAVDDIAAQYGCQTVPTAVGEINVAKRMAALGAVIGGEGNGGVMLPDLHIGRDAPVAAALVLQCFANARKRTPGLTISALKASLPQYEIVKTKVATAGIDADAGIAAIKAEWLAKPGSIVNTEDGLHVSGSDWWIHIRKSNTEPIVRVIGEAPTAAAAEARCNEFLAAIAKFKTA